MRNEKVPGSKFQVPNFETWNLKPGTWNRLARTCLLPSAFCFLLWPFPQSQTQIRSPKSVSRTPPSQPIPFSHRQHAVEKLKCALCHEVAGTGERAGFPSTELCMACHQQVKKESAAVGRLAEYHAKQEPVPWARVYKLPDFVFFSHARHLRAKADCVTCHGPVQTRDALWQEKEITMAACVECHKQKRASIACHLCHELK